MRMANVTPRMVISLKTLCGASAAFGSERNTIGWREQLVLAKQVPKCEVAGTVCVHKHGVAAQCCARAQVITVHPWQPLAVTGTPNFTACTGTKFCQLVKRATASSKQLEQSLTE